MHSSRMRTAHSLLYGGLADRDPPGKRPPGQRPHPWTETPPLDRDPTPGQRPHRDPTDRDPLDRDPPVHLTYGACWDRDPPCEQNDTQV